MQRSNEKMREKKRNGIEYILEQYFKVDKWNEIKERVKLCVVRAKERKKSNEKKKKSLFRS